MTTNRLLRVLLLCPLFLLMSQLTWAQTKTISGKVTDEKGSPVAGASILVKGTKTGVSTDASGSFSVSVPASATTLIVSYVGYTDQEVSIGSGGSISVSLKPEASSLNDVVVVGYGTARKRDLTGSVTSVSAKDFNGGTISAPDQLLQNKVAGLEVTNTSGEPGAASTIQIRGTSSIRSGNNPLFVVDGVPLDGGTASPSIGNAFGGSTPNSNPLLFINPNDIASISVLKDAASAAIYGSRGANGVIEITTKKGSAGPMKVEAGASFGTFAGYMKRFAVLNASQYKSAIAKYGEPTSLIGSANVDPFKEITQNDISQNYTVALSGGNNVGKFRASFLASSQNGFLKKSWLDKYLANFGGDYKFLDDKLTIDFNLIAGNYGQSLSAISNNPGSTGDLISSALSWNPTQPFSSNGLYNFPSNGSGNPLALSDAYSDITNVSEFLGNISAAYKIVKNLEYKFLYGINYGSGIRKQNEEGWLQGYPGLSGLGNADIATAMLTSQTFTHTLDYKSQVTKDLNLDAIVGYEYFKTDYSGSNIFAKGFNTNLDQSNRISIPYTNLMQDAQTQNPYSTFANPTSELQSYFGRVTLNYQDKYILTGSLRADGSSKFGKNNKYGYFPAVGVRWVVNKENFMMNSKLFSNLDVRASYGITGNQEFPAGSSQEQFSLSSYNNAPQIVNGNPDLKWESTKSVNLGLDFGFNNGKIYGSVDYYNKNTSDILFQTNAIQPAPSSVSFINLPNANLVNSGVEVALGATLVSHQNFTWDITGNVAYNKNIIKNFKDPNTGLPLLVQTGTIDGQGVSGTLAQVITNNQPVNVYYLKTFGGFDQNGNQIIGANPGVAGDPNPHVLLGFSTTLTYHKFVLSINTGGAFGFLIYNNTATSVTNISGIAQGRNIDLAAYNSAEAPSSGVGASTRFLEKGNYFKLRNATIRYNIGDAGKYVKNLSAFVSGTNLFVITKFTGFDPEVNIDKTNNSYPSRSIEYVPYPTPRTLSFGFNFSL